MKRRAVCFLIFLSILLVCSSVELISGDYFCSIERSCPGSEWVVTCYAYDSEGGAECGVTSNGVFCHADGETHFYHCPPEA